MLDVLPIVLTGFSFTGDSLLEEFQCFDMGCFIGWWWCFVNFHVVMCGYWLWLRFQRKGLLLVASLIEDSGVCLGFFEGIAIVNESLLHLFGGDVLLEASFDSLYDLIIVTQIWIEDEEVL
jgi:hypothetical protein